jgi:LssY-like putative type I secretion system component LssY
VRLLKRFLRRVLIFGLGVLCIWLIVFVFRLTDRRLPTILALALTYGVAAYLILPRAVRMGLKILLRKRVPRFTITGDGLPGDPVNLVLIGTLAQLRAAFAAAGWSEADPLGSASSWRMVRAFVLNKPYPTAPFSTLYLYGRGQDIGFQKAIDNSPRRRHHIRFWALSPKRAEATVGTASFWLNTDRPPHDAQACWVGAGTKDTGLSLTRLTFQITHATDSNTNTERDFIIAELRDKRVIGDVNTYQSGRALPVHVNRYITDGEVTVASLTVSAGAAPVEPVTPPVRA